MAKRNIRKLPKPAPELSDRDIESLYSELAQVSEESAKLAKRSRELLDAIKWFKRKGGPPKGLR